MKIEPTLGDKPTQEGIYCVRQWYGWRILEWWKGEWWHVGKSAKWPVSKDGTTSLEAYFGPLPTIVLDHTKPAPHRGRDNRAPQVFAEQEAWEARLDWDGEAMQADDAAREYDL